MNDPSSEKRQSLENLESPNEGRRGPRRSLMGMQKVCSKLTRIVDLVVGDQCEECEKNLE